MKEEKEALSVRKMNSESKVRRCAKGAEKGALAWGVRLTPLGIGERENTLPPLGIPFLWGHAKIPSALGNRDRRWRRPTREIFFNPPSHGSPFGVR